jgi:Flp pilus assembly protein TadB
VTTCRALFGLILVALGILLILDNINWIDIGFGVIWPLVLVFAGLYIILKEYETKKRCKQIAKEGEKVE